MAQFIAIAGAVMSVVSKVSEGRQAKAAAGFQADQLEQNAGQERAASQRQAIENRRQARLATSRLQALAGGGGSDPTVVNLAADLAGEGEYRAMSSLYEGEERARHNELSAASARLTGKAQQQGAVMSGIGQALQSGSQIYSRYGGGGPASNSYSYNGDASGSMYSATGADVRGRR